MIIALVRHGQTEYNAKKLIQGRIDNPLNKTGKKQANDLALQLLEKNVMFDRIISSPLSRALETAFIISRKLNIDYPIYVVPHLLERDFNELDGVSVDIGTSLLRNKNYDHPGYETDKKLISRVVNAVLVLSNDFSNQTVLAVAHSHVIKALLVYTDPVKYSFTDYMVNNGDIVYFEVINHQITFLSHER